MALITCPDCAQQISDAAPTCPHCGRPSASATALGRADGQHGATKIISIVLILLGGYMFVSSMSVLGAFLAICGVVCLAIALIEELRRSH